MTRKRQRLTHIDAHTLYHESLGDDRATPPTPEQEDRLCQAIVTGRQAAKRLSKDPDQQRLVRQGELARIELVERNRRLVASIARYYAMRGNVSVPMVDLAQEGHIGLMRAIDKFEPERGYRFSTYATWWVRQAVLRAIATQSRTIRQPVHMYERIGKIIAVTREFEQSHGVEFNTGNPLHIQHVCDVLDLDIKQVMDGIQLNMVTVSLDNGTSYYSEDGDGYDYLAADDDPPIINNAIQAELRERLEAMLAKLPAREAKVIILRFGLVDGKPLTLTEVGKRFGLTRERIRQLEMMALSKLRHPKYKRLLREFIE